MNDLIKFDYQDAVVRVVTIDDAPWFAAPDVAGILGYNQAKDMTRNLDEDEKGRQIVPTLGGDQELSIISESGLYNAIFRSRRDEAKEFRRWVTGTVLPEIRRTGRFALAAAPTPISEPLVDVDCTRFSLALSAVSLMRKLRGNAAALALWDRLGLPAPHVIADTGDGLPARVMLWVGGRDRFTNDELAAGLGLGNPDSTLRARFGDILRAHGFDLRRIRRGRSLAWGWVRECAA